MAYKKYPLESVLPITHLYTFFYLELTRHFYSPGEKHDFWELVYVDKGDVEIVTDLNRYELTQGDIVFYKPNEFHSGRARNGTSPILVILSFECKAEEMNYFEGMSFRLDENERKLLSLMVEEGMNAFDPPINSRPMARPRKNVQAPIGSEQLIQNYLEILLIQLIRKGAAHSNRIHSVMIENQYNDLTKQVTQYLKTNLSERITLEDLCKTFAIGRTRLSTMFKANTGMTIMEHFNKIKIEKAKQFIRDEQYNFTQIAEHLNYSSVHYFSKQFKQITGMTPTEYSRSVRARK